MTRESVISPPELRIAQLADSVMATCDRAAEFTDVLGQVTRLFLSPATKQLHGWLTESMQRVGLSVRTDTLGNLVGHYPAADEGDPASGRVLLMGSHIDAVVNAGRYDGILGAMLAIAVIESLDGARLPFAIDVLAFSEEEGVRFRTPYLGSAAVAGCFERRWLELIDSEGITLSDAISAFGLDITRLSAAAYSPERVIGYLEAHIEQGPVLMQSGWPVAVVTALAGQSRLRFRFTGRAGHAGTVPMDQRADALAAAAELISAVESFGRSTPGLRATVGAIDVHPNVRNVIAGDAVLSVDVRHPDDAQRHAAVKSLLETAHQAAKSRGVNFHCESADEQPAVACDIHLRQRLAAAIESRGYPYGVVFSGAGHDVVSMSRLCPSAMLFIRHPGVSHHPSESVAVEDVAVALDVLRQTILGMANNDTI